MAFINTALHCISRNTNYKKANKHLEQRRPRKTQPLKMKIGVITPTRGERPQLLEQCKKYVAEQTRQPFKHYIIDYTPINESCDIIPRIKEGLKQAKNDGCEYIFIFEDDDYYNKNYIETVLTFAESTNKNIKTLIIGCDTTTYYHLPTQTIAKIHHSTRSSLFATSFGINALNKFDWPNEETPNLDFNLWRYAREKGNGHLFKTFLTLGVKHGIGKCGGMAHNKDFGFNNNDQDFSFLKSVTRKHFNFYKTLQTKLK